MATQTARPARTGHSGLSTGSRAVTGAPYRCTMTNRSIRGPYGPRSRSLADARSPLDPDGVGRGAEGQRAALQDRQLGAEDRGEEAIEARRLRGVLHAAGHARR